LHKQIKCCAFYLCTVPYTKNLPSLKELKLNFRIQTLRFYQNTIFGRSKGKSIEAFQDVPYFFGIFTVNSPGTGKTIQGGGRTITDVKIAGVYQILPERSVGGIGLQVLNVGTGADPGGWKAFSGLTGTYGTEAAEVVHIRGDKAAVTEKTSFQAHLGKSNIVINPFLGRFFGIIEGQVFNKTWVHIRVNAEEKQRQSIKGDTACAHNTFRSRGKFGTFRERPFLLGTDLRRKSGDCFRKGTRHIRKGFRSFKGNFLRRSVRAFRDWNGKFGNSLGCGIFAGSFGTGFRNYTGSLGRGGYYRNPCLWNG
jgi:hypothetical protein